MVRFIVEAKSKDCPWFPSVLFLPVPLWKESSLVFIKPREEPRSRNSVPLVHSVPKLSPVQSVSVQLV